MSPKIPTRRPLARPSIAAALLACLPSLALAEGTNDVDLAAGSTEFGSLDATTGVVDVGFSDDKADADKFFLQVPLTERMKTDAMGEGLRTFEEAARASQFDALDGNPAAKVRTGPAARVAGGRSGKSVKLMLPTGTLLDGRALQHVGGMKLLSTGAQGLAFSISGAASLHGWSGEVILSDSPGAGVLAEGLVALVGSNVLAVQLTPASLSGSSAVRVDTEAVNGRRAVWVVLPTADGRLVQLALAGETEPPAGLVSELASAVRLSRNTVASASPSFGDYQAALDAARTKRLPHLPETVASSLGFIAVQPADPTQRNLAGISGDPATRATAYLMADGTTAVIGVGTTGIDERAIAGMLATGPVPPFVTGSLGGNPAMTLSTPAVEGGAPATENTYLPLGGSIAAFLSIQGPGADDDTLVARIAAAVVVPEWLFTPTLDDAAITRSLRNQFSVATMKTVVASDGTVTVVSSGPGASVPVVEPGYALQAGLWGTGIYATVQGAKLLDQNLSLGLRLGLFGADQNSGFAAVIPAHYRYLNTLSGEGDAAIYSELSGGLDLALTSKGVGLGLSGRAAIYAPLPGVGGHLVIGAFFGIYAIDNGGPTGVGLSLGYQFPMPGMN